jgi:hypothetical protein
MCRTDHRGFSHGQASWDMILARARRIAPVMA